MHGGSDLAGSVPSVLCLTWLVEGVLSGSLTGFVQYTAFRENFSQAYCYRMLYSLGEFSHCEYMNSTVCVSLIYFKVI